MWESDEKPLESGGDLRTVAGFSAEQTAGFVGCGELGSAHWHNPEARGAQRQ
jgi:hypothetical protein